MTTGGLVDTELDRYPFVAYIVESNASQQKARISILFAFCALTLEFVPNIRTSSILRYTDGQCAATSRDLCITSTDDGREVPRQLRKILGDTMASSASLVPSLAETLAVALQSDTIRVA